MSVHSIPCWQVRCDWPGCTASPADVSEYAGWEDKSTAVDEASDMDWWISLGGHCHYCNEHPTAWASDLDQVAGMTGDYLLIHDGDTGDPTHDGTVSFVKAVTS